MSFSVVIVALDAAADLALTIESVVHQTFRDFEIIILDGYSVDSTKSVLRNYAEFITTIVQEADAGIFDAMNRSVKLCSKDYIIFLNAKDRLYSSDVLEKVWRRKLGEPDVLFGEHIYVDGGMERYFRSQRFDFIWQSLVSGDISPRWHESIPCHQATFTRRSLLESIQYDTRLELCADHNFLFQAFSKGCKFQYIDEIICHYFGGGLSARRTDRLRLELVDTYRRHSKKPDHVDRYFLGAESRLFPEETALTGLCLTGFDTDIDRSDFEKTHKLRWCYNSNFTFITPDLQITEMCSFVGFNPFGPQRVAISFGSYPVSEISLPHGHFSVSFRFDHPLQPKSELLFSLQHTGPREEAHGRSVSLALGKIVCSGRMFLDVPQFGRQESVCFCTDQSVQSNAVLLQGWSVLEHDRVWSIEDAAYVCFRVGREVEKIRFEIGGNP
jgi:glycosyltransferase involved in cell wall biosynthesis